MEYIGGIFASQVIRLIDNIYRQTMHIYICGELPLWYQSEHKTGVFLLVNLDRFVT